ncbi:MAG TPA: histidine--tRNA ligase [Polyangiaceae bacterium]|nr:histidine--tRNA ligase [Polyangiaceae bacterium]
MTSKRIEPRTLKGFRDYLPDAMARREALIDKAKAVYRSFGFAPIDTPALEYAEILLGKGSEETDKQTYRFADNGGRDVALRFDLTVPFARFVAQHLNEIGTPFKRYHIGSVWRGENTQRGRYREFMQCDFDIIGTDSVYADVEIALVINRLFESLGVDRFTIHLNNRKVLNGLLEAQGLAGQATAVLRALDKLAKIGADKVVEEMMATAGASEAQARSVVGLADVKGSNSEVLESLRPLVGGSALGVAGIEALSTMVNALEHAGVPNQRVRLDLAVARGLDYYTGTVFETFLDDLPTIGSCCSGGRYDNLASLYTSQVLPGVGASLGLDRLLAALEELKVDSPGAWSNAVLIVLFDAARYQDYLKLANDLRQQGITVEVYPEAKKLGVQLKYADRRGHRLAVILGDAEWQSGKAQLKDLRTNQASEVALSDLPATCSRILANPV